MLLYKGRLDNGCLRKMDPAGMVGHLCIPHSCVRQPRPQPSLVFLKKIAPRSQYFFSLHSSFFAVSGVCANFTVFPLPL